MADSPTQTAEASAHIRTFVATHGRTAVTILVGGAAAVLGTILPFAQVNGLFGGGQSFSIVQSGFYGLLLLVIAALLGIFPIMLKQYVRFVRVAFGVASALFGIFFAIWIASSGMLSILGSGAGGLTVGFFFSLIGYGAMVVGYYQMLGESHAQ